MENYTFRYVGSYVIAYFRLSGISSLNTIDKINEHCDIAYKRVLNNPEIFANKQMYLKIKNKIENHRLYGVFQELFKDYILKKCHIITEKIDFTVEYSIFGAGIVGRQLKQLLFDLGVNVRCFIDDNSALWGTNIDGVDVVNLHDIKMIKGSVVLISSYEYSDEMAKSLNDLDLKENQDYYTLGTWVKLIEYNMVYEE